jgi:hypothetical protein
VHQIDRQTEFQNSYVQWIWSSPLTGIGTVGCVWVIAGPYLQCVTSPPSQNADATTVVLLTMGKSEFRCKIEERICYFYFFICGLFNDDVRITCQNNMFLRSSLREQDVLGRTNRLLSLI